MQSFVGKQPATPLAYSLIDFLKWTTGVLEDKRTFEAEHRLAPQ